MLIDLLSLIVQFAPTNFSAFPIRSNANRLTWTNNLQTFTYQTLIERAPDAGGVPGTFQQVGSARFDLSQFDDQNLSPSTIYWYRLRAVDINVYSAYTSNLSSTTLTPFYVRTNGNDSWDGTSPTFVSGTTGPWLTLAHAAANVSIGSTGTYIDMGAGTFLRDCSTSLSIAVSGATQAKPLVIGGSGAPVSANTGAIPSTLLKGSNASTGNHEYLALNAPWHYLDSVEARNCGGWGVFPTANNTAIRNSLIDYCGYYNCVVRAIFIAGMGTCTSQPTMQISGGGGSTVTPTVVMGFVSATVNAPGSGYPINTTVTLTISGGVTTTANYSGDATTSGTAGESTQVTATTNASGQISGITGVSGTHLGNYTTLPGTTGVATTGGGGSGCTLNVTWGVSGAVISVGSGGQDGVGRGYCSNSTTLASAFTAGGTTLSVADGSVFSTPTIVKCGGTCYSVTVSGNVLTITGIVAGTTDANHPNGIAVQELPTVSMSGMVSNATVYALTGQGDTGGGSGLLVPGTTGFVMETSKSWNNCEHGIYLDVGTTSFLLADSVYGKDSAQDSNFFNFGNHGQALRSNGFVSGTIKRCKFLVYTEGGTLPNNVCGGFGNTGSLGTITVSDSIFAGGQFAIVPTTTSVVQFINCNFDSEQSTCLQVFLGGGAMATFSLSNCTLTTRGTVSGFNITPLRVDAGQTFPNIANCQLFAVNDGGSQQIARNNSGGTFSIATYASGTGATITSSAWGDPKLNSPLATTWDLTPLAGSPCLGTASNPGAGLLFDVLNNQRPGAVSGTFDIGAYQLQQSPSLDGLSIETYTCGRAWSRDFYFVTSFSNLYLHNAAQDVSVSIPAIETNTSFIATPWKKDFAQVPAWYLRNTAQDIWGPTPLAETNSFVIGRLWPRDFVCVPLWYRENTAQDIWGPTPFAETNSFTIGRPWPKDYAKILDVYRQNTAQDITGPTPFAETNTFVIARPWKKDFLAVPSWYLANTAQDIWAPTPFAETNTFILARPWRREFSALPLSYRQNAAQDFIFIEPGVAVYPGGIVISSSILGSGATSPQKTGLASGVIGR